MSWIACRLSGYFNPRSREGSDGVPVEVTDNAQIFQSTLP